MEDWLKKITAKAYKYCTYQDRCRKEVQKKLYDWGVYPEHHEALLAHLEEEKFLDDTRYAHSFVRGKFLYRKWGKVKISFALREKGIDRETIQVAIQEEISTEEYSETVTYLAEKKLGEIEKYPFRERRDKLARYLSQKGYEWDAIKPVLDTVKESDK